MSDLDSLFAQASSLSAVAGGSRSTSPSSMPARVRGDGAGAGSGVGTRSDDTSFGTRGRFGRGGGILSSKSFAVISVSGSDPSVCFGSVGVGSASFCVRQNCSIKAHVDSKVEVWDASDESRISIVRSPGSTVFAEPSVSTSRIPSDVWASWERQQLTLSDWSREFCAVEIANDAMASVAEIKEESSFLEKAKDFRTPSKRVRESASRMVSSDFQNRLGMGGVGGSFVPHLRLLPVVVETEGSELSPGGWTEGGIDDNALSKVVSQVETSLVSLGEALGALVGESHNRFLEVGHEAKLIASALHSLSSSVGTQMELDERFEAPTLWGSTAFIADEIMRLGREMMSMDLEVKPIQMEVGWLKTSVQNSALTSEESLAKLMKILGLVMQRIQSVGPELELVKTRVGKMEVAQVELQQERNAKRSKTSNRDVAVEGSGSDAKASMDDLLWMLGGNSIQSPTSSPRSHRPSGGQVEIWPSINASSSPSQDDRGTETAQLFKQLVADVALLKATVKDDSVKFGGLGLRSIQDCQGWIHTHFDCYRYGLMMDPLLLLDRICGNDDIGTKSNKFKTWESRSKLKITTGAEESALHAISVKRPQLFHVGKTAMVSERNKSKLNQLANFAAWKSGGEGVRNYIVKQMNSLYSTLTHEIAYALGSDVRFSKADALAIRCLNDSITFLTQLMNFVDMSYERLLIISRFTPEQAWSLTTQILDRICEELYSPKEGVSGAMTIEEPESVCCHILWATFKTHDIMATYIDTNFENHPVVSAEYVKFLATNSGSEKVEKLESQVSGMTEKLGKAVDESKKAAAKSDVASTKCSELVRELAALTKKVKALGDKR
jgi:hypothetical protein